MKFDRFAILGALGLVLSLCVAIEGRAEPPTKGQRKCIERMNKSAGRLAGARAKLDLRCLADAAKGDLSSTLADCWTGDPRGKVAKSEARLRGDEDRFCTLPPEIGHAEVDATVGAALRGRGALMTDLLSTDPDGGVADCETDSAACRCQRDVAKFTQKLAAIEWKEFLRCKKAALGAGAETSDALADCIDDENLRGSVAADARGKIGKGQAKLEEAVARRCDSAGVAASSFPGSCGGLQGQVLAECIARRVRCRTCQIASDVDDLTIDCDDLDDGTANESCASSTPAGPLLAFPGAVGFGRFTQGGRGGYVVHVTNLDDSGTGSLRWAVAAEDPDSPGTVGPRTVVFEVSGIIHLSDEITVDDPFLTIAGQTSPAGITVAGSRLKVRESEVIVRGMRFRAGDAAGDPVDGNRDGFGVGITSSEIHDFIFDHCSATWAMDENGSSWGSSKDTTIQNCLFAEGLDGSGGFGYLVGTSSTPPRNITFFRNVFISNKDRNPKIKDDATSIEVINNYVYNWRADAMGLDEGGESELTAIGNYFRHGPDSIDREACYLKTGTHSVYLEGNIDNCFRPDASMGAEADIGHDVGGDPVDAAILVGSPPFTGTGIAPIPASEVPASVLATAGAIHPVRDPVDQRILATLGDGGSSRTCPGGLSVNLGSGAIISSIAAVGGFPVVGNPAPPADTDRDGMPDSYEDGNGLDKTNAADRNTISASGYTMLEEYLNSFYP